MRGVWRHSRRLTVGELSRYLTRSDIVVNIADRRARERGWRVTSVDNDDEFVGTARATLAPVLVAAFPPVTPAAGARVRSTRVSEPRGSCACRDRLGSRRRSRAASAHQ